MAGNRMTLWPGSVPDDDTLLSALSEQSNGYEIPVSPRERTDVSGGATSAHRVGMVTSRRAQYDALKATTKGKRTLKEMSGNYLLESTPEEGDEEALSKKQRNEQRISTSNRLTYHEFMSLDQAGPAVMGCDNTKECNLVAIKRLKGINKVPKPRIQPFTSNQVVELKDMFFDEDDNLVTIYEQMEISLRAITGILPGLFQEFQIAAICKELVGGLVYIHSKLSLYHGDLNCGTILLNRDGMIKIANIGDSFARNKYITTDSKSKDIQSIGFVMMELMEPATYVANRRSAKLQNPQRWKDGTGIKEFLKATQHEPLESLQNGYVRPVMSDRLYYRGADSPSSPFMVNNLFLQNFGISDDVTERDYVRMRQVLGLHHSSVLAGAGYSCAPDTWSRP